MVDLGCDGINGDWALESANLMKKALRIVREVISFEFERWFD